MLGCPFFQGEYLLSKVEVTTSVWNPFFSFSEPWWVFLGNENIQLNIIYSKGFFWSDLGKKTRKQFCVLRVSIYTQILTKLLNVKKLYLNDSLAWI